MQLLHQGKTSDQIPHRPKNDNTCTLESRRGSMTELLKTTIKRAMGLLNEGEEWGLWAKSLCFEEKH